MLVYKNRERERERIGESTDRVHTIIDKKVLELTNIGDIQLGHERIIRQNLRNSEKQVEGNEKRRVKRIQTLFDSARVSTVSCLSFRIWSGDK